MNIEKTNTDSTKTDNTKKTTQQNYDELKNLKNPLLIMLGNPTAMFYFKPNEKKKLSHDS